MVSDLIWAGWREQYADLQTQPLHAETVETWLRSWSDLEKQVYEQQALLNRAHFANTSDVAASEAYDAFLKDAIPTFESARTRLTEHLLKYLRSNTATPVEWQAFINDFRQDVTLYREENISIQAEDAVRGKMFSTITNNIRVDLNGSRLSLNEAQNRLLSTDREVREAAYRASTQAEVDVSEQRTALLLDLLPLRQKMATNAGHANFHEFMWQRLYRSSYTPADIRNFRAVVRDEVVPLLNDLRELRRQLLNLATLRPWDLAVNPFQGELKPNFTGGEELASKTIAALRRVDEDIASCFERLTERGDADLEPRPGKTARSFSDYKTASREAIIFIHGAQRTRTVHTLMHEVGHAFHFESIPRYELYWNFWPAKEFKEFVAQSMEVLTLPYLAEQGVEFYRPSDMPAVQFLFFERILLSIINAVRLDDFQEWLYTSSPDNLTPESLQNYMIHVLEAYGLETTGEFEAYYKTRWQTQNVFMSPLYQIEYALAWMASITLWEQVEQDREHVLERYKAALAIGAREDAKSLYTRAGVPFDFSRERVNSTMIFLRNKFKNLI